MKNLDGVTNPKDYVTKEYVDDNFQTSAQVDSKIATHNASVTAHPDIRTDLSALDDLVNGKLIHTETVNNDAYSVNVPSTPVGAKELVENNAVLKYGGRSVVKNQKMPTLASITKNGVQIQYNGDGTYTINGTATSDFSHATSSNFHVELNHKYYFATRNAIIDGRLQHTTSSVSRIYPTTPSVSGIYTCTKLTDSSVQNNTIANIRFYEGTTYDNEIVKPQIIDLTQMFGAGNEPTTVEEAERYIGTGYIPYNVGEVVNAVVNSIDSKDSSNTLVESKPIPQAVKNLPAYGAGVNGIYNEIDWVNKKYIQRVDKKVLNGTQRLRNVNHIRTDNGVGFIFLMDDFPGLRTSYDPFVVQNILNNKYPVGMHADLWSDDNLPTMAVYISAGLEIRTNDLTLDNAASINAYLSANPITVIYELETPIITDISDILTDDEYIKMEAGGTVTFTQSDLPLPVPSTEEYTWMLK